MPSTIRKVEYFYTTIEDRPGEALKFLSALADLGVNLLAMTAVPVGLLRTQLTIFPEDASRLADEVAGSGLSLDGPYGALLIQGDDVPGALIETYEALSRAGINVYASTGVAGGQGDYGAILYVRPEDLEEAVRAVGAK